MNIKFTGPQQVLISSAIENIISENDFFAYWEVLGKAFDVHLDREKIRQGLWKDYPAEDQFNQIKIKIDRVIRSMELLRRLEHMSSINVEQQEALRENVASEMHDIINYAVFGTRIVEGNAS